MQCNEMQFNITEYSFLSADGGIFPHANDTKKVKIITTIKFEQN